jgi:oligoendopeptidase F
MTSFSLESIFAWDILSQDSSDILRSEELLIEDEEDDEENEALEVLQEILDRWAELERQEDIDEGIGLVDEIYDEEDMMEVIRTYGDYMYMFETVD